VSDRFSNSGFNSVVFNFDLEVNSRQVLCYGLGRLMRVNSGQPKFLSYKKIKMTSFKKKIKKKINRFLSGRGSSLIFD